MKKLTIERYDEFLDALNEGFNKEAPKWFARELGHIYPSIIDREEVEDWQRKLIQSNYYLEKDGRIASGLAIYNMDMKCALNDKKFKLKVGGIGSVFTSNSERGKGLMTSNLKYTTELLAKQRCDISWLAGDRKRYSRFGWDIAGRIYEYKISFKGIKNYYEEISQELTDDNGKIQFSKVDRDNLNRVKELYDRYGMGIERDRLLWERQINRSNLLWRVYKSGATNEEHLEGYFVAFKNDKSTIVEIQGDNVVTIKSLISYMNEENIDMLKIRMPYGEKTMNRLFMSFAADVNVVNAGMIKVINSMSILSKINYILEDEKNEKHINNVAKRKMQLWNEDIEMNGDNINWWISDIDKV